MSPLATRPPGRAPAAAPPGAGPAPDAVRPAGRRPAGGASQLLRGLLSSAVEGTPGRMRLLGAVAVLAAVGFGLVGALALWSSSAALERADHNTAQVVRVEGIYADLVRADADATNAFLVGGLESPAQRADYDSALARVAAGIVEAARAQPADGTALGALNAAVQRYAATVEQARVYNRQGMPVGAQYLNDASASLRSSALPIVETLTQANTARANAEFAASSNSVLLTAVGAVALLLDLVVLVWLARRTHRYLNVPLAVGAGLVVLALLLGTSTTGSIGSQVASVRGTDFAATLALASARSAAFDAKSNESLTLIARGSGSQYEARWAAQSAVVLSSLARLRNAQPSGGAGTELVDQWNAYVQAHRAIRQLDDAGTWEQAVTAAARTDPGSANQRFAAFDAAATSRLEEFRKATEASLLAPRTRLAVSGLGLLVLSLGAALLAVRGVGQRLEEYR